MVVIDGALLVGQLVSCARSDGSWALGVITAVKQMEVGKVDGNDHWVVQFGDGSWKTIFMQNEVSLFLKPHPAMKKQKLHKNLQDLTLMHEYQAQDSIKPSVATCSTAGSNTHAGSSTLMPPEQTLPVSPHRPVACIDDVSDAELLELMEQIPPQATCTEVEQAQ